MKFLLIPILLALGCAGKPSDESGARQPAAPAAGGIRFSDVAKVSDFKSPDNWCNSNFSEGVPVMAEPTNSNRRFFPVGDGLYHIVTRHGGRLTSWLVRRTADGGLELFTSNHFPSCLSDHRNFSINPDGMGFYYDSGRGTAYPVEWLPGPDGGRMTIEMAPNSYFGIEVHKTPKS